MATFIYPQQQVTIPGTATEAKQDDQIALEQQIVDNTAAIDADLLAGFAAVESLLTDINTNIVSSNLTTQFLGDIPLLDTSSINIPASSGNPLEIVTSSSIQALAVQTVEDIGSFIGLYEGPALSETLVAILPLGGGQLGVSVPGGARISVRAMENTAISSGKIAFNFLG